MNDLASRIATANFPKFGPASHRYLRNRFSSFNEVWEADLPALLSVEKMTTKTASLFIEFRKTRTPENWINEMQTRGIQAIALDDPHYPRLLKETFDPPSVLFVRGNMPDPKWTPISMVGSRHCTQYGRDVAEKLAEAFANGGLTVVSGGAYGIDEASHRGAVKANGLTVAVLGAGLDHRPTYREKMLHEIIINGGGAVVSELSFTTPGYPGNFPVRNRIVAGMTRATIVVEAARPSGTLITANAANKEGRDVFVVPGPITSPMSRGCHQLIKEGAAIICEPNDVFEGLGLAMPTAPVRPNAEPAPTPEAQIVMNLLSHERLHIDEISRKTGLSPSIISASLSLLELQGSARHLGGMYYVAA